MGHTSVRHSDNVVIRYKIISTLICTEFSINFTGLPNMRESDSFTPEA